MLSFYFALLCNNHKKNRRWLRKRLRIRTPTCMHPNKTGMPKLLDTRQLEYTMYEYPQSRRGNTPATCVLSLTDAPLELASTRAIRGRTHPHPSSNTARDAAHGASRVALAPSPTPVGHPRARTPPGMSTYQARDTKTVSAAATSQECVPRRCTSRVSGAAPALHTSTHTRPAKGATSTRAPKSAGRRSPSGASQVRPTGASVSHPRTGVERGRGRGRVNSLNPSRPSRTPRMRRVPEPRRTLART